MLLETLRPCAMRQVEYDGDGQVRERYTLSDGLLDGPALSYDERGLLRKKANYKAGVLDGEITLYGPPGPALFSLPARYQPDLDRGGVTSAGLRSAFSGQRIELADDVQVAVEEPGHEWTIAQAAQLYTILNMGAQLAVCQGRIVERASFAQGWLCATQRYAAGQLHGARARYTLPGPQLFTLPNVYLPTLAAGDIAPLRTAFARQGRQLSALAQVTADLPGVEWLIEQADQTYSVRSADQVLVVYPGRLTQRQLFVDGSVVANATFKNGQLDGVVTLFQATGDPIRYLSLTALPALDKGDIATLNVGYGLGLSTQAQLSSEAAGLEWFIVDAARSYTIQRVGPKLGLFAGRVSQKVRYQAGQRAGIALLFAADMLVQSSSYAADVLHGPMAFYSNGKKQTEANYSAGVQNGRATTYDDQGLVAMYSEYKAGQLHGRLVLYQHGRRKTMTQYRQGKQHGLSIVYFPDQKNQLVAHYQQGLLHGSFTICDQDGNLLEQRWYQQGLLEGLAIKYDSGPQYQEIAIYHRDNRTGPYLKFGQAGNLIELRGYVDGQIRGIAAKYYPTGWLQEEAYYSAAGMLLGIKTYDQNGKLVNNSVPQEKEAELPNGRFIAGGPNGQNIVILMYDRGKLTGDFLVNNRAAKHLTISRSTPIRLNSAKSPNFIMQIYDPPGTFKAAIDIENGEIMKNTPKGEQS